MNMSFLLTRRQIEREEKDVTRRLGDYWKRLRPGKEFNAVDRCQGFRAGEHPTLLKKLVCVRNDEERLGDITQADVIREGFPNLTPDQFVVMFCEAHKRRRVTPDTVVNRIEFAYVTEVQP